MRTCNQWRLRPLKSINCLSWSYFMERKKSDPTTRTTKKRSGSTTTLVKNRVFSPQVLQKIKVHPQNVRFQNVRFQNVRFQNVWNVRFTKCQDNKTSGLQNVRFTKRQVFKTFSWKKNPYIFCTCDWWKSAGSVAAMFAGKVMAVFYLEVFCHISP